MQALIKWILVGVSATSIMGCERVQTTLARSDDIPLVEVRPAPIEDPADSDMSITPMFAAQNYELIQRWLRDNGLLGRSGAELAALASTDAAASSYQACHESSKSPTGHVSRIELLSVCLRGATGDASLAAADLR